MNADPASSAATLARPERRHHHLVVTTNTEYHLRDDLVFAVRRRGEEPFLASHAAVGLRLDGAHGSPRPGDRLWLVNGEGRALLTTPIELVGRPPLDVAKRYPTVRCAPAW